VIVESLPHEPGTEGATLLFYCRHKHECKSRTSARPAHTMIGGTALEQGTSVCSSWATSKGGVVVGVGAHGQEVASATCTAAAPSLYIRGGKSYALLDSGCALPRSAAAGCMSFVHGLQAAVGWDSNSGYARAYATGEASLISHRLSLFKAL
jgi:hypothetical protein